MDFQPVLKISEMPANKACLTIYNGLEILVGVTSKGYFAIENKCSHQGKPLTGGRIRHGHISCPVHGQRFNLETGEAVGRLTNKPIKIYQARVNEDWLEVCEISI
ncbi:MAG: Rieske (2Fe-2S) protein [Porticoccaceae bacterium]|nr:Rieske (2Fe-2S) protein [Porticoccaceae bacterium]